MLRVGVAWWPGGRTRHRALYVAVPASDGIDRGHARPGRRQRHVERRRADHGVRVEHAPALCRRLLHPPDEFGRMDRGDGFLGERAVGAGPAAGGQSGGLQAGGDRARRAGISGCRPVWCSRNRGSVYRSVMDNLDPRRGCVFILTGDPPRGAVFPVDERRWGEEHRCGRPRTFPTNLKGQP